jgi:hypothetical protein
MLRLWRLTAASYSEPSFEGRLGRFREAVQVGNLEGSVPIEEIVPDWSGRLNSGDLSCPVRGLRSRPTQRPTKRRFRCARGTSRRSGGSAEGTPRSPDRCAVTTSSVSGRYSRCAAGIPFRQPPRTAGIHPDFPVRTLSHRTAYASVRAANSAPKNATFHHRRRPGIDHAWSSIEQSRLRRARPPGPAAGPVPASSGSSLSKRTFSARN